MQTSKPFDPKNPPQLTSIGDYRFFLYIALTFYYLGYALINKMGSPVNLLIGALLAGFFSYRYFRFIFTRAPQLSKVKWAVQRGYTAMARATYTGLGICNVFLFAFVVYYVFGTAHEQMVSIGYICGFFYAEMLLLNTKYDCGITDDGFLLSSTFAPFKDIAGYRYDSRRAKRVIHHQYWFYKNVNDRPKLIGTFTLRDEQVQDVKDLLKKYNIKHNQSQSRSKAKAAAAAKTKNKTKST